MIRITNVLGYVTMYLHIVTAILFFHSGTGPGDTRAPGRSTSGADTKIPRRSHDRRPFLGCRDRRTKDKVIIKAALFYPFQHGDIKHP